MLEVPAGAFASTTSATIRRTEARVVGDITPVGEAYDVSFDSPGGPQLPVKVTLPYVQSALPDGVPAEALRVGLLSDGIWIALASIVDSADETVSAWVPHFSVLAPVMSSMSSASLRELISGPRCVLTATTLAGARQEVIQWELEEDAATTAFNQLNAEWRAVTSFQPIIEKAKDAVLLFGVTKFIELGIGGTAVAYVGGTSVIAIALAGASAVGGTAYLLYEVVIYDNAQAAAVRLLRAEECKASARLQVYSLENPTATAYPADDVQLVQARRDEQAVVESWAQEHAIATRAPFCEAAQLEILSASPDLGEPVSQPDLRIRVRLEAAGYEGMEFQFRATWFSRRAGTKEQSVWIIGTDGRLGEEATINGRADSAFPGAIGDIWIQAHAGDLAIGTSRSSGQFECVD